MDIIYLPRVYLQEKYKNMNQRSGKRLIYVSLGSITLLIIFLNAGLSIPQQKSWKAGVAEEVMTPKEPLWMAGYANRDRPSEGTLVDIWTKVLALEDAEGKQSVLITMELRGIPKAFSDNIRDQLKAKYGLSRAQIILNVSHTHSGPVLSGPLVDIYPVHPEQREKIEKYTVELGNKIIRLVGKALNSMEPVQLYSGNGLTRFQVNRRNNNESEISSATDLNGPNDYAVPVIKAVNRSGKIKAIAFGYACHNTVLNGYKWSGDYSGYAQIELEKEYPGAMAMFFQGCGGDQNPLPRHTEQLARQYGMTLAASVQSVIGGEMKQLAPRLSTAYKEFELPLSTPPSKAELVKMVNEYKDYPKRWAARLLSQVERGEPLMTSYPYPLQIWRLGDQTLMTMGGEVVVEYAIQLKRIFGKDIFVLGYSNDRMGYIPSELILKEGGYEGATSIMTGDLPSPWAPGIEDLILRQMEQLADQTGVPKSLQK